MKEVIFNIDYEGIMDVINTIENCNKALKEAGVPVEFVIDRNEHTGYDEIKLKKHIKTYTNEIARLKELFEDLSVVCSDLPFKTVISYIINIPENQMNLSENEQHYIMDELFSYWVCNEKSYCPEYLFVDYYNTTHRSLGTETEWFLFRKLYTIANLRMVHRDGYRYRGYEGKQFYDVNII